jgi:glycosyltransferase involved in cell wall biosynthesis
MRILFLTGRELDYARNEVLLRAFQRLGVVDVDGPAQQPRSLLAASLQIAARAAFHLARTRYDLVFVGFYGYFILHLLRPFLRVPVLFDAFVSNYDTLCFDRKLFAPHSMAGRIAFQWDRKICLLAGHVLLDTQQHVNYFVHTLKLPGDLFTALPVGCSDDIYTPELQTTNTGSVTRVLGYCTYLPLHGVDVILRAAALVTDLPMCFRLVGSGRLLPSMQRLAAELQLRNVTFAPPVAPRQLAQEIAAANLCLGGHFGASEKAARVIPGKIYQMLAVGRAVIAADAPGNRELLAHGESAYLVPPDNPEDLATALRVLHTDVSFRMRLAQGGQARYSQAASEAVLTEKLHSVVAQVIRQHHRPTILPSP